MISLLACMFTFRKQWTYFEMLESVDVIFNKDFAVITPKKIYRKVTLLILLILNVMLVALVVITYYTYNAVLGIPSTKICISYYLGNLPYFCVVMLFCFTTNAITRRFDCVNSLIRQLAPHDIPKNMFEICSRTTKNDVHTPTIALSEIYSIYGSHLKKNLPMSPPNKSFKSKDEISKEIKKLTSKLENREESIWRNFLRRNIIEIEEFKLSKMQDVDEIIEHLTKLLDVHDLLLDCISIQNEILSFQILIIVAQIFVFEVFALFSLYRTVYDTAAASNVLAFANIFWLTVYNGILYFIMSISTECIKTGKFTGTCVHKVINKISYAADPRVIEKVKIKIYGKS